MRVQEANRIWKVEYKWDESTHLQTEIIDLSGLPIVIDEREPKTYPN